MYVAKLVVELWTPANGVSDIPDIHEEETSAPSWEEIEAAIRALDNKCRAFVMLQADVDHWIGILGGGADERYRVTVTDDEIATYYLAVSPTAPAETVRLVDGGQVVDYSARECVDLATALRAAKTYAQSGVLDPSIVWVHS